MSNLRIDRITRWRRAGDPWVIELAGGMNLLVGDRNTSKSTTLQIIDFCFGNDQNPERRFGRQLVAEYEAFEVDVTIGDTRHVLARRLHERGLLTRTLIDGEAVDTSGFNEWIAGRLGWQWPPPTIPKGVVLPEASDEIPLTFRATLRHLYRNASSWTGWADREFEYIRRAVLAQFLGIVEPLFRGSRVEITRQELRRQVLEDQRVELREFLDSVVRRVAEGFREEGHTGLDSLEPAIAESESRVRALRAQRAVLVDQVRVSPQFAASDDARLGELNDRTDAAVREVDDLRRIVDEQFEMVRTLDADLSRFDRARTAGRLLDHFEVSLCPVCHQSVHVPAGEGTADAVECYLCHQPLQADALDRRIDLERTTVLQDKQELENVVSALAHRLDLQSAELVRLRADRTSLLQEIESRRHELVSPLLSEFEDIQRELGRLEQQSESLKRLAGLRDRVTSIDDEILKVQMALDRLQAEAVTRDRERALIRSRCDRLAKGMNQFADEIGAEGALGGPVSIDPRDLTFYVGTNQWEYALGDERKVLFFLGYHFALLEMALSEDTPFPRLAILDNPFQQDVPISQVEAALELLAALCQRDPVSQVIVTSRRPVPAIHAHRVQFNRQFNAPTR